MENIGTFSTWPNLLLTSPSIMFLTDVPSEFSARLLEAVPFKG